MARKNRRFARLAASINASGEITSTGLASNVSIGGGSVDSAAVNSIIAEGSYATQSYVTTQVNNLVDGAPGTLNTLNEIAAALNDDNDAYNTLLSLVNSKVDSAAVIGIVDSAYIEGIVDSAYVSARAGTSEAASNGYGDIYAGFYTTLTSGTKISVTGSGSTQYTLNTDIDNASDGDILVLEPGVYKVDCTSYSGQTYYSDPFRTKELAIVGNGDSSNAVVLTIDHTSARDKPIFGGGTSGKNHLANMRIIRNDTSGTSYVSALVRGTSGGDGCGFMRNVIFDNNNGANITWVYDNGNSSTNRVRFNNCSFVNYQSWGTKYSGSATHVRVTDCAFDDTRDTAGATFIANAAANPASVTFDASYDYSPNTTYGHKSGRDITSSDISITNS